jgi:hypothetical protein
MTRVFAPELLQITDELCALVLSPGPVPTIVSQAVAELTSTVLLGEQQL